MAIIKTLAQNADVFRKNNRTSAGLPGASTFSHAVASKRGGRILLGIGLNPSNNDVMQGDALGIVTPLSPITALSESFNVRGASELVYLTPAGTIAANTIVFPADNQSRIGQSLSIASTQTVTALTVTSANLTLIGTAVTALVANAAPVKWKKVAAATWMRE
jgi:hypothetical protein